MPRLRLTPHEVKLHKESGHIYRPDFIIYDFNKEDYLDFWADISKKPREYLYTDGINVAQVSWFRVAFESFKGWLGFDNHCHPAKIDMTLAKIAYVGYLNGFHSDALNHLSPPPLSKRFIHLINQPKSDTHSKELQDLLISHYKNNAEEFPSFVTAHHSNYHFGQAFISDRMCTLISTLEPQETEIIHDALSLIRRQNRSPEKAPYVIPSKFAKIYAESLIIQEKNNKYWDGEKISEAIEWDPEVPLKFKEFFINFYFHKKDPASLTQAVKLLDILSASPSAAEQSQAVTRIKKDFSRTEQLTYLVTDSQLRKKVAKSYLADAEREKKKGMIDQFFTGNNMILFLAHAVQLDPLILDEDSSMQDIQIRADWLQYQFNMAIDEQRFQDAETLYEQNLTVQFSRTHLNTLLNHYLDEHSANNTLIKTALAHKNADTLPQLALKHIAIARKIARIDTQCASMPAEATFNYALILLEVDKIKHPLPKDANLQQLNLAESYLCECNFLNNTEHCKRIFNELLLRKIDCLIGKLGIRISCTQLELEEFAQAHQMEIECLKKTLKDYISLNESNKSDAMRAQLAKAYYLLADTMLYFERKEEEAKSPFKKAIELMPENPYYREHYHSLVDNNTERNKARKEIKEIRRNNVATYDFYMEERWKAEKVTAIGFDIHAIAPQPSGILTSIFKTIGFN